MKQRLTCLRIFNDGEGPADGVAWTGLHVSDEEYSTLCEELKKLHLQSHRSDQVVDSPDDFAAQYKNMGDAAALAKVCRGRLDAIAASTPLS